MKPYYERNGITIFHGDCRDILPTLAAGSVDLVLTDPPYGIGKRSRTYATAKGPISGWDNEFSLSWAEDASRLALVLGVMPGIVNLPRFPVQIGRLSYRWALAVHVANGMTRGAFGYWNWIPCLVYAADNVRLYQQVNDIGRVAVKAGDRPDHPSPKPLEAMTWLLTRLPGQTILDPFMGSGSTLVAAQQLGRRAIGIEIEERYCAIAAKRLAQDVLPLAGRREER